MNSIARNEHLSDPMSYPGAITTLVDSIPALVAYIDCNMQLQYCNKPFQERFRIGSRTMAKSFQLLTGEAVFDQVQRHMGKVLVGQRAHFQISVNTPEGIQYLDATLSPDIDDRKRVRGFIFHSSDVTEKNRTERALKDYFENSAIGIHWVNEDGIVTWANPAELQMLGYSAEEYIGHHISKFHADRDRIDDIMSRLRLRETLSNYDADLLCKDGSIRHVTISSTARWEDAKFIHTRCFTIDVTERKRAVKAVIESEERFRMIALLAPLIIWTTDEAGAFNFVSEKWAEVTGTPAGDALGNAWLNKVHADDRENIRFSWAKCLRRERSFEARFRLLNADGEYKVSYVKSIPRFDESGVFGGYIGFIQDVSDEEKIRASLERMVLDRTEDLRKRNGELKLAESELKKKNEELAHINSQLESFAHIASHDLQEPLRKIQTYSTRLFSLEGHKFSDEGKDVYRRIDDSSNRMRNLIRDLLAYSKSNDNEEKSETTDLNALLDEVLGELDIKITEKRARIENRGLPVLDVIKFQFHQLFLNLISNALKFTKPDVAPHIIIEGTLIPSDEVNEEIKTDSPFMYRISIGDNGIGFDSSFADKIFEMFHRLHSRRQFDGTGIGLAICKKIVENHRGIIRARSEPGLGATFDIYLPERIGSK